MAKKKIPQIVKEIKEFKPEGINYAFQKNISYSQLSMYRSCPLKWALQYKEGIKVSTPSIHTVFGTSLHQVIQHYLDIMYTKSGEAANRENIIEMFEEEFRNEYKNQYQRNNNLHFSTSEELREFYEDGVTILEHLKSKKGRYFSKRGWYLVGCEIPVVITPNKRYNNVVYQGYLDVVLYHEPTNEFKIIDIKTSTNGWNADAKKDEDKQFQLILYKQFFSEQFRVPVDSISIEFFILRRKIYENTDYNIPRVQCFTPPSGKIKLAKATKAINEFIEDVFDKDGYKDKTYIPTPSKHSCNYCPFKENKELCNASF